jgi:argininosuccinate synthase
MPKVVLAYSGGLDTSCSIRWLQERYGLSVVTLTVDVGQPEDLEAIAEKARRLGALRAYVVDAREEFVRDFVFPALRANARYEGVYPLISALSRPLIARHLVEVAEREGAEYVAHGCTGKGNDQVRIELGVAALNPRLKVLAPVREWRMSRPELLQYAKERGIPVKASQSKPYSIDENLWGRSIEAGVLEDPTVEPPEDAFEWTRPLSATPEAPLECSVTFEAGVPVALNGVPTPPVALIRTLNEWAGLHGVGRIDHIESRLVGIKSREVYEAPAATVLLEAHAALEHMVLPRELLHFKQAMDLKYAELVYYGLWYSPLREALDAFMQKTQEAVTGTVHLRLWKGHVQVIGRTSPYSLYQKRLATYDVDDAFDHRAAEGFIRLWGLDSQEYAARRRAVGLPVGVSEAEG